MQAQIIKADETSLTISVVIPLSGSMLEGEEAIRDAINAVGKVSTGELLKRHDTDGTPIMVGGVKLTSKGEHPKVYQTPYGEAVVLRHVYQSSEGGRTYCPLDENARIIVKSTPLFAKQVSSKYAEMGGMQVKRDLEDNHGRKVTKCLIQDLADAVADIALTKEDNWSYAPVEVPSPVRVISIGIDGANMQMAGDGWREAMVGTIVLYDERGERLHTTYVGAAPEYGKGTFFKRMNREIEAVKSRYPNAIIVGLADGAVCNWEFLKEHTEHQTLDFYHAAEYLAKAADALYPNCYIERSRWLDDACLRLMEMKTGPQTLLKEMQEGQLQVKSKELKAKLDATITYFDNNKELMTYSHNQELGLPIGSGVTEAAAKIIVKQRLCQSGMRWQNNGAQVVMSLRTLTRTLGRWTQFWSKISQYGLPA